MLKREQRTLARHQGKEVVETILTTPGGFSVGILNYGGIVWQIKTPDANGQLANVLLQHREFDGDNPGYLGAITGRFAGRINQARFVNQGAEVVLQANHGGHCLHGGFEALDKKFWEVQAIEDGLELSIFSADGENGFPGNVQFKVRYLIRDENQLTTEWMAFSDQETPLNLTHHLYFDLTAEPGCGGRQLLQIASDCFGEIDETGAFTGHLIGVENTPFDFRMSRPIQPDFSCQSQQLRLGYDHPFLLKATQGPQILLRDAPSGRCLSVQTSEPVVVIYTANHLDSPACAVCIETQRMPNAVNLPEYRDSVLCSPARPYFSRTVWRFSQFHSPPDGGHSAALSDL